MDSAEVNGVQRQHPEAPGNSSPPVPRAPLSWPLPPTSVQETNDFAATAKAAAVAAVGAVEEAATLQGAGTGAFVRRLHPSPPRTPRGSWIPSRLAEAAPLVGQDPAKVDQNGQSLSLVLQQIDGVEEARVTFERARKVLAAPDVQGKDLSWVLSEIGGVEEVLKRVEVQDRSKRECLLTFRDQAVERYLLAENRLTFQVVLGAWRSQAQREASRRAIDGCVSRATSTDTNFFQRVQILESELEQLREEEAMARHQQEVLLQEERKELSAATSCCHELEGLVDKMAAQCLRIVEMSERVRQEAMDVALTSLEDKVDAEELLSYYGSVDGNSNGHIGGAGFPVETRDLADDLAAQLRTLLQVVEDPTCAASEASDLLRCRPRLAVSAEGEDELLQRAVRTHFATMDADGDGLLQWHSGEIRRCVTAALGGGPAWNDWEWYAAYRNIDADGIHRMDVEGCIALTREVRKAIF